MPGYAGVMYPGGLNVTPAHSSLYSTGERNGRVSHHFTTITLLKSNLCVNQGLRLRLNIATHFVGEIFQQEYIDLSPDRSGGHI